MAEARVTVQATIGPDHLQALGQMTLLFGFLDQQLTHAGATLRMNKDGGDWAKHRDSLLGEAFTRKARSVKALYLQTGLRYGIPTEEISGLIDAICSLADHRNDIVHGWIDYDEQRRSLIFKNKDKPGRSAEPAGIDQLNRRITKHLQAFVACASGFLQQVAKKNAQKLNNAPARP